MSYNVDHVEELELDATMAAKDVVRFLDKHRDECAEINFLDEIEDEARRAIEEKKPARRIKLKSFWWSGSWSGNGFDFLKKKIAPLIKGTVRAVFTWEGGDSHSGLVIEDGVVREKAVKQTLVDS